MSRVQPALQRLGAQPRAGAVQCPWVPRARSLRAVKIVFERRNSVLERLPQHPALAIGEGIKRFDDLGAGLDIKLYVPPGTGSAAAPGEVVELAPR